MLVVVTFAFRGTDFASADARLHLYAQHLDVLPRSPHNGRTVAPHTSAQLEQIRMH
jgi:hypothetical protein